MGEYCHEELPIEYFVRSSVHYWVWCAWSCWFHWSWCPRVDVVLEWVYFLPDSPKPWQLSMAVTSKEWSERERSEVSLSPSLVKASKFSEVKDDFYSSCRESCDIPDPLAIQCHLWRFHDIYKRGYLVMDVFRWEYMGRVEGRGGGVEVLCGR